jgi:serine/threonine protein phosphatase PrpC
MNTSTAIVTCPNQGCKAPNPSERIFCHKCNTYIPKRYLWTVSKALEVGGARELLGDRYLVIDRRMLLDTLPGAMPTTTEDIPEHIVPYLKLSGYQPQIPKVYGLLAHSGQEEPIWLLEDVPIYSEGAGAKLAGKLMPRLVDLWGDNETTTLRQFNWLAQIVELWQPMVMEGVASTLIDRECLRTEGSLIRILELAPDRQGSPTLADLGRFWQESLPQVHPSAAEFWQGLCQKLISGQFISPEQVLEVLNTAQNSCADRYNYAYQIATYSDKGPTRSRNEDACYPASGSFLNSIGGKDLGLTIVCDGIGGHEGGNVASNMAIEAIHTNIVGGLTQASTWDAKSVSHQLESYVRNANDRISQRNDSEQRQSRQRMGTTVVMAVSHGHEVYLAHVGDSRAYRISRTGCHQVTLDDDLAAREVRLGYALYREALQHSSSGSLIQALGMGGSYNLHPTVQKFVIDEDCIFLLCSDGLSDRDRVEQYWEALVLPVLERKTDLATLSKQLLDLGNQINGHDNVTIGLLYCQAQLSTQGKRSPAPIPPVVVPLPPSPVSSNQATKLQFPEEQTFIQRAPKASAPALRKSNPWRWGFLIPLFLGLIWAIGYIGYNYLPIFSKTSDNSDPSPTPTDGNLDRETPSNPPSQFYRTTKEINLTLEANDSQTLNKDTLIEILEPLSAEKSSENVKVQVCFPQPSLKKSGNLLEKFNQNPNSGQPFITVIGSLKSSDFEGSTISVPIEFFEIQKTGDCSALWFFQNPGS